MAIPLGTTSRQLATTARWMLASVVTIAMLALWWPNFIGWGAAILGVTTTLTLWLMHRIVSGDRQIPAQPVYYALLAPAAILLVHFVAHSITGHRGLISFWVGAMDLSMLFHLALLVAAVMLAQSLLPRAASYAGTLSVCGAAMIIGPSMAMLGGAGQVEQIRPMLTLLGLAGVGVWLTPLWGIGRINEPPETSYPLTHPVLRRTVVVVAAAMCGMLTWTSPRALVLPAGLAGAVLLLSAAVFRRHRRWMVLAGGLLLAGAAVASVAWLNVHQTAGLLAPAGPFGLGEIAFAHVSASDSGPVVLGQSVGWVGMIWMTVGLAAMLIISLLRAGRLRRGDQGRAIIWVWTTALATCALLSPGGLQAPAVLMATALAWGLLPRMLGRPQQGRPGLILLLLMAGLMVAVGVARSTGLVGWSIGVLAGGSSDKWLHVVTGLLLALMLAWRMAGWGPWWGLVGVVLAGAAGGAGEVLQQIASAGRSPQWADWMAHGAGSAAALVLYGLCVGARWCESADVHNMDEAISRYRL
ncbi:hypothetical protein LCGC14_0181060 [marine sediment metagenome]|uniref:Uncharacterized protein n=1 Tax=marine sediment metagenome TaxID=412755 RepID=A0A0F9XS12_9ZZZZ|nr:hypothetical protein [Phycisphaerae bacterium]HDZ44366.1 hypothetical protein [Phycisphaerae bacterium]